VLDQSSGRASGTAVPVPPIRQSINVLDLTRIANVLPVRTLRQFVTQIRHGDVRAVPVDQPVDPKPALLIAC
jgi:hypothetical protein